MAATLGLERGVVDGLIRGASLQPKGELTEEEIADLEDLLRTFYDVKN